MKKELTKRAMCLHLQRNLQPHQFADFCRQLKENDEVLEAQDASEFLNLFCDFYWQLENLQKSCFDDVISVLINASRLAWVKIIPQLIEKSMICNDLIFLAEILIKELSQEEREKLDKIYPFTWTKDDEYTSICEDEYNYRQSRGLKSWIYEYPKPNGKVVDYRRSCCIHDFDCFYAMLNIQLMSGQSIGLFMGGYFD